MRRWLIAHEDFPPPPGFRVRADFSRKSGRTFGLTLSVYGQVDLLDWQGPASSGRCDDLWKQGCFEAFVRPSGGRAYVELNFAPVQRWAAYRFDDYRQAMRNADVVVHRQDWFVRDLSVPRVEMQARVDLPSDFVAVGWQVNVTTILETKDGTKSFWALAHAPGPPDFHNRDCFIATLPAPTAP